MNIRNRTKVKKDKNTKINTKWNLGLLYKSIKDPQIEKDIIKMEHSVNDFAKKYDISDKDYLKDESALLGALAHYERLNEENDVNASSYFSFTQDLNANNKLATSKLELLNHRLAKIGNKMT